MTDVLLFQEADGGNIESIGGRVTMAEGLETGAFISLFGGNERDSGGDATEHLEWWGNKGEVVPARKLRSRTQALLASLPLIPANLLRIEDAAAADLAWFKTDGPATFVGVRATLPALNTVTIEIRIEIDDAVFPFEFTRHAQVSQ